MDLFWNFFVTRKPTPRSSKLIGVTVDSISLTVLKTKLYNVEKVKKSKGGRDSTSFLDTIFIVPTQTVPRSSIPTTATVLDTSNIDEQLMETKQTVKDVKYENRLLKRKLDRRDLQLEKVKVSKIDESSTSRKGKTDHVLLKSFEEEKRALQQDLLVKNSMINSLEKSNEKVGEHLVDSVTFLKAAKVDLKTTTEKLKGAETSNDYLMNLLNDNATVHTKDSQNAFTPDMIQCVMNLLSCNVSSAHIPNVLTHVSKLVGVNLSDLPSRQTVDRINDSRIAVSQRQIESIAEAENLTLYSDETSKYGRCFEVFAVTDTNKESYLLGMREMFCKSASCVLDTFKEIIDDINACCVTEAGSNIVAHIKNTMSDRAATEKKFHVLLEDYRSEILPKVVNEWEKLDGEERGNLSKMNNFFCGLHLLVNFADVCSTALKHFEKLSLNEKVGAEMDEEEGEEEEEAVTSEVSREESGTVRLVRCSCKAFSRGGDEKCGVYGSFKTFMSERKGKVQFQRFKHNRFNVLFLMGGATYHHLKDVQDFLENVQGGTNRLLRSILADVKVPLLRAGARALGLISKVVTGPLWREIEKSGHILEMGDILRDLQDFLQKAQNNSMDVITGELRPFADDPHDDHKELYQPDESDAKTIDILQCLFGAMYLLLQRQAADHLPGGKFASGSTSNRTWEESSSTLRHNKLPEFFFGQLDFLMKYRPNATMLCNEAFVLFSHNKTGEWLSGLEEGERDRLLKECRAEGREIRQKFKERIITIENHRLERLQTKEKEMKGVKERAFQKKEKMTNDILYFGLWQSEDDMTEKLLEIDKQTEKILAVKAQLNFRKTVLHQVAAKELFQFSKTKKKRTLHELTENLKVLIMDARKGRTTERPGNRKALLVGKRVSHHFSDTDTWYRGKVVSVVPNFVHWYNITYDNDPAVYVYRLQDDYEAGALKILLE